MDDNQDIDSETDNSVITNDSNEDMAEKGSEEPSDSNARRTKCKKCHCFMYTTENIRNMSQKKSHFLTYMHKKTM